MENEGGKMNKESNILLGEGPTAGPSAFAPSALAAVPARIAGMRLEDLLTSYRNRLFNLYLPFWEKGGYDAESGGFMCYLFDDGRVQNGQKDLWYQGRGIWTYSFLHNHIDKNPKWLEMAKKSRDFMVKYMYKGNGFWLLAVSRDGKPEESIGPGTAADVYGSLFAAGGLIQLYKATGKDEDLHLIRESILKAVERYEDPNYMGVRFEGMDTRGFRSQSHSFMIVWILSQLLEFHEDSRLDELAREHLDHILCRFWNDDYGISNEMLHHDYSRIRSRAGISSPGHTVEALWMAMVEALREKNASAFLLLKDRIRRMIELSWDYIFGGMGYSDYYVFDTTEHAAGGVWDLKAMWAHCEILIAAMTILEYTGEVWAKEWYERCREWTWRVMSTDCGVFRQAVDRYGNNKARPGIPESRRDNFHEPRYYMMNILSLERIMRNRGSLTPLA
jgi:mannose/cellobiose epimerase-like protein (N-acyl-D-glucosamine 2-epimerase family)